MRCAQSVQYLFQSWPQSAVTISPRHEYNILPRVHDDKTTSKHRSLSKLSRYLSRLYLLYISVIIYRRRTLGINFKKTSYFRGAVENQPKI